MLIGNIIHDNGSDRVLQVAWNQGLEPFLACCVPKLQTEGFAFVYGVFGKEVDAYCGLHSIDSYIRSLVEAVVYVLLDDARLPDVLVPEEHDLVFYLATCSCSRHLWTLSWI